MFAPTKISQVMSVDRSAQSAINDEVHGRRMELLFSTGASRFFDIEPSSMVQHVQSASSDLEMLSNFIGAMDQVQFNEMKENFEILPTQMQEAEFVLLPVKMQKFLRGAGYELPSERKQDGLLKRIFTWDIPVLPEEHMGSVVKVGLSPLRAMGFFAGGVARNIWEYGIMKPSRFATHAGRSIAHRAERGGTDFLNPRKWKEAWDESEYDDGSYYKSATDKVVADLGRDQTELLKIFLRKDLQGVYDKLEEIGLAEGKDSEAIRQTFISFFDKLDDPDIQNAFNTLESGRLTTAEASVRAWNRTTPWDVRPGTAPAKAIGIIGSLATEILLDPLTYVGGFWIKGMRAIKAGVRATDSGRGAIDMWRRIATVQKAIDSKNLSSLDVVNKVTGEVWNPAKELRTWLHAGNRGYGTGLRIWAATKISTRANARAINRMQERIEAAFKEIDLIDDYKLKRFREDPSLTNAQLKAEINEKFFLETGGMDQITALSRDLPAISAILPGMKAWHRKARNEVLTISDDALSFSRGGDVLPEGHLKILKDHRATLSEYDGFWEFLADEEGWNMLASKMGGVSPEARFLPAIGGFGAQWIKGKKWIRKTLDFDKFPDEGIADIARMTATYLSRQADYIHKKLWDDIQSGSIQVSKDIDEEMLTRILNDPTIESSELIRIEDLTTIEQARTLHETSAARIILEDGELDPLLKWYQANGYEIRDGSLVLKANIKGPFHGPVQAAKNYYHNQIHPPGSANAELGRLHHVGAGSLIPAGVKAFGVGVAYYPARFAEKLLTYTPRNSLLDVTDANTAISEFTALVDMGVMAGMSRTRIDNYIRTFIMGNDSERWLVQSEFFLDFIGRSGALLNGGRDVQEFIQRFIRYGHQRYANFADEAIGIQGLERRRGIIAGEAYTGHLTTTNIIPNYRELGAVSRYMALYRNLGWGSWLPKIDKFMSRTWRPAVLLRLGYVARNGGEELASFMWREGPRQWQAQKAAQVAAGRRKVWDEYGRKIWQNIEPETQTALIWKPFSRIWRSINEVAGVGDYAITRKAIIESIEKSGHKWRFLSDEQKHLLFKSTRERILHKQKGLGSFSRMAFEWAEAEAQKLSALMHYSATPMGIGTKQQIAKWIGRKLDKNFDQRVLDIAEMYTNPTFIDTKMKHILGTFDSYIAADKVNLDTVLKQGGFGVTPELQLPMNYGATELRWASNIGTNDMYSVDKSVGVGQRLDVMSGDPSHIAALKQIAHYSSPQQEATFGELVRALGLPVREGETNAAVIYKYFHDHHRDALRSLDEAFDIVAIKNIDTVEKADEMATKLGAIEEFIDAMPDNIKQTVRKFLEPVPGVGANPNPIAFLLHDLDVTKITNDWVLTKANAKQAFVNDLMSVEGQQRLISTHRSNISFDGAGDVLSMPLPEGHVRLFVPLISQDLVVALGRVLTSDVTVSQAWFDDFVERLSFEFTQIGVSANNAEAVARMLQPSMSPHVTGMTPSIYGDLAIAYKNSDANFFPLLLSSPNDAIASAVSRSLDNSLLRYIDGPPKTSTSGRIGSIELNAEELFNDAGAAVRGRSSLKGPPITTTRNGVNQTITYEELADIGDIRLQENFWGWGPEGPQSALDFGANGMRGENIIGLNPHLLYPHSDGLRSVQMIDNEPLTHRVRVYQNKQDGRTASLRVADENDHYSWYNEDEWDIIDEQIVTHNDLRNAAEELAMLNLLEIEDLFTSGVRTVSEQGFETFNPWIREILNTEKGAEISPWRIHENAVNAGWWEKAPEKILTFVPVTNQAGSKKEVISKAWNTLLRNWFDGVVNPMIGAMVREPMFQHYYTIAKAQTVGARNLYNHSPDAYKNLEQLKGVTKVNGQVQIDSLEGFIKFDYVGRSVDPDDIISKIAFNIETRNFNGFKKNVTTALQDGVELPPIFKAIANTDPGKGKVVKGVVQTGLPVRYGGLENAPVVDEFFDFVARSALQFETHRDLATKTALTLTSAFIDDHRIRSQFQEMVGTILPFWFAEDQFLRRMGRSINHNPLMLRRVHLTMNAGINGGLIQENQRGDKILVIPGSETATTFALELAEEFPIIGNYFGGPLGFITRASLESGLSTSINVIPGYDLERIGSPGFGPLLVVPLNLLAHRDPSIRQTFEKNLVGGRFQTASEPINGAGNEARVIAETIWSAVVPAVIARPLQIMQLEPFANGAARNKAAQDVMNYLAMNGRLPEEKNMTPLEKEKFYDEVDMMAMQLQLLQSLSWALGPNTATLADLTTHEGWEWNKLFQDIVSTGVPYQEAYGLWVEAVEAFTGEPFNPLEHSPFMTGKSKKVSYAVLEAFDASNQYIADNPEFIGTFKYTSAYFLPRKFDEEDTEFSAEAKTRQLNLALTYTLSPEEFLEELYSNAASGIYHKTYQDYLTKRYKYKGLGMDTSSIDFEWQVFKEAFDRTHPVFAQHVTSQNERRDNSIAEMRLLVQSPELVPDTRRKDDILKAMAVIVDLDTRLRNLTGRNSRTATDTRNRLKFTYMQHMEAFVNGKPWLNELYYSVFLPLIGDSWMAKFDNGLINLSLDAIRV